MKKVKTLSQDLVFIAVIAGLTVSLNILASWWFARLDLSENRVYSISPATKRMLKKLDDIINIKVYFSRNLPPQLKTLEADVRDLLAEYKAYGGGKLRISWEDPSKTDETRRRVRELGIPEVQLNTYEKDKAQVINGYLGIAVLFADKKEILPVVQDMKNFEYDLTQAVMKVNRSETPKVGVLKTDTSAYIPESVRMQLRVGQDDATKERYKPMFEHLGQNYDVELVSVQGGTKIDGKYRTLIVPGGANFTTRDIFEIDQYFMNGGNLIVLADAVKVSFEYGVSATPQDTKLLQLLEHYGARVEKSLVLDVVCGQVQVPQRIGMFQMNIAQDYPYFVAIAPQGYSATNPAVAGLGGVILPWVSPITILTGGDSASATADTTKARVVAEALVMSSPRSWVVSESFNLSPTQQWQVPKEGLKQHNLVVHVSGDFVSYFAGKPVPPVKEGEDTLSQIKLDQASADRTVVPRNANRHLVVVGDSDFMTTQNATPGNVALLMNLVDWLTLDENLIGVRTRNMVDRFIQTDRLKGSSGLASTIRWVNILLMPVALAIVGLVIFARRREHALAAAAVVEKSGGKSA